MRATGEAHDRRPICSIPSRARPAAYVAEKGLFDKVAPET